MEGTLDFSYHGPTSHFKSISGDFYYERTTEKELNELEQ